MFVEIFEKKDKEIVSTGEYIRDSFIVKIKKDMTGDLCVGKYHEVSVQGAEKVYYIGEGAFKRLTNKERELYD